jgi:predicted deacetylase
MAVRRTGGVTAQLVVSVSGLVRSAPHVTARLADELDRRSVPMSLLITPKPLLAAPEVTDWLRARSSGGDALLLRGIEGWAGRPRPARWHAGVTVLPAHETRLQLLAARAALAHLDLAVDGFAPPGWLVPTGTLEVLRRNGFRVCAELRGVRDLRSDTLLPGRVLGLGAPWQGERTEPWWCRAAVLGAARAARLGRLVRLAVPAADLARPGIVTAVLDAVDIALHHGAVPTTYAGLVERMPVLPSPRRPQTSASSARGNTVTAVPSGPSRSSRP